MNTSKLLFSLRVVLGLVISFAMGGCFPSSFVSNYKNEGQAPLSPLVAGARTWIVLPDTQIYMKSDENLKILSETAEWIVSHRVERNIEAVFQVGDIVDNNSPEQWVRAKKAFSTLDNFVPLILVPGNHDTGADGLAATRDTSLFNQTFKIEDNRKAAVLALESFEKGRLENTVFQIGPPADPILVFALEFGPRDRVLKWAADFLKRPEFAHHRAMLVTHEYMDEATRIQSSDGMGRRSTSKTYGNAHDYELSKQGPGAANCGQEIWNKLIKSSPQFEWILSGHYDDYEEPAPQGKLILTNGAARSYRGDEVHGHNVHQFMYDAQWVANGGDGWFLMIELSADGRSARARTFSPWRQAHPKGVASPQVEGESLDLIRK